MNASDDTGEKSAKIILADDLTNLASHYGTDKWGIHRYTPHYQQHFSHLRLNKLNLLEIGVGGYEDPNQGGESLRMWKHYFPNGKIDSIDIFDKSALQEERIKIFIFGYFYFAGETISFAMYLIDFKLLDDEKETK